MIVCVPCVLLFLIVPFPAAWLFVFVAEFFLFFNTGPTNTILANVVHPAIRATAFALNILIIHTLGDAISPPLVGAIADHFHSLSVGFVAVSIFIFLGGAVLAFGGAALGGRYGRRPVAIGRIMVHEPGTVLMQNRKRARGGQRHWSPRDAVAGLLSSLIPNPQSLIPLSCFSALKSAARNCNWASAAATARRSKPWNAWTSTARRAPQGIRRQIDQAGRRLIAGHSVRAIGIGFGGPVDAAPGRTMKSHQIEGWHDFPLVDWCRQTLALPAAIANDADAAGLAEARFGAGRGQRIVFYITVGSGIGGAW